MKNISKSTGYLIVAAFWLAICLFWSTTTQAQTTLCDSNMTYTIGSQMQLEVAFPVTGNNLPYMAPIYAVTYGGGNMLSEDSCFGQPCTHIIYNYNPNGTYYDTLTTCVSYVSADSVGNIDTLWCCFDQYWNGQAWARVMMQQQNFSCDSISYFVDQGIYFNTNLVDNYNNPDSSMISWSVCNTSTCYTGEGTFAAFPMIQPTDTLKVCYDAYLYYGNAMEVCNQCDSMVYSQGSGQWVLYNYQGNTTGISELEITRLNDNKIYDMLGRELTEIPLGTMYIRNQKLYITK